MRRLIWSWWPTKEPIRFIALTVRRVYLGSFAGPYLNPRGIAIDQANNRMFVTADNGIFIMEQFATAKTNVAQGRGSGGCRTLPVVTGLPQIGGEILHICGKCVILLRSKDLP